MYSIVTLKRCYGILDIEHIWSKLYCVVLLFRILLYTMDKT